LLTLSGSSSKPFLEVEIFSIPPDDEMILEDLETGDEGGAEVVVNVIGAGGPGSGAKKSFILTVVNCFLAIKTPVLYYYRLDSNQCLEVCYGGKKASKEKCF
jgi:hypothetical protein